MQVLFFKWSGNVAGVMLILVLTSAQQQKTAHGPKKSIALDLSRLNSSIIYLAKIFL
jgi:hypothetical protein